MAAMTANSPVVGGEGARLLRPPRQRLVRTDGPSTTASIPSRYRTFFYASTENKGFNSRASRFSNHLNIDENPGPGSYTTHPDSLESNSTSFSQKGMGGLASKKARFSKAIFQDIGPGSYNPQILMKQQDFNQAEVTSNFHSPIAVKTNHREPYPAPNSYNSHCAHIERNNLITAEAAFKSRSKRDMKLHSINTPAPGQYSVSDKLLHPSSCSYNSVFNSKSNRVFTKPQMGPGPGHYSPYVMKNDSTTANFNKHYRQKHFLCFSAPALPLPPDPPLPGPGHYETQNKMAIGTDKGDLAPGAVFKSTTGRWISSNPNSELDPGPGTYDPLLDGKRSYLLNFRKKWV